MILENLFGLIIWLPRWNQTVHFLFGKKFIFSLMFRLLDLISFLVKNRFSKWKGIPSINLSIFLSHGNMMIWQNRVISFEFLRVIKVFVQNIPDRKGEFRYRDAHIFGETVQLLNNQIKISTYDNFFIEQILPKTIRVIFFIGILLN